MSEILIDDIRKLLPHSYPFLLVDRVTSYELNKSIVGFKNVSINEPFFQGHFPARPIMPGVLIIEAMAQLSGVLALKSAPELEEDNIFFLAGVDNARFKKIVSPGDKLILNAEVIKAKKNIWKLQFSAFVDEKLACSADIIVSGS